MNSNRGFTLIELMVVVSIIAVTAAITVPNMIGWLPNYRLSSGARTVLTALQNARMRAIKENRTVAIQFDVGGRTYFLFSDDGNSGAVPANAGNFVFDAGETVISRGSLPPGVSILSASFGPNGAVNHLTGRGWASFAGSVQVVGSNNKIKTITILQTGNAAIQ